METQSFNQKLVLFPNHFVPIFLEFKHIIVFCYENQHSLTLQGHVSSPQVWVIAQIVANILGPMVQQCVESKLRLLPSFSCLYCVSFVCQI